MMSSIPPTNQDRRTYYEMNARTWPCFLCIRTLVCANKIYKFLSYKYVLFYTLGVAVYCTLIARLSKINEQFLGSLIIGKLLLNINLINLIQYIVWLYRPHTWHAYMSGPYRCTKCTTVESVHLRCQYDFTGYYTSLLIITLSIFYLYSIQKYILTAVVIDSQ